MIIFVIFKRIDCRDNGYFLKLKHCIVVNIIKYIPKIISDAKRTKFSVHIYKIKEIQWKLQLYLTLCKRNILLLLGLKAVIIAREYSCDFSQLNRPYILTTFYMSVLRFSTIYKIAISYWIIKRA